MYVFSILFVFAMIIIINTVYIARLRVLRYQAWLRVNLLNFEYEPSKLVVSVLRDDCVIVLNYGGSGCVGMHV